MVVDKDPSWQEAYHPTKYARGGVDTELKSIKWKESEDLDPGVLVFSPAPSNHQVILSVNE